MEFIIVFPRTRMVLVENYQRFSPKGKLAAAGRGNVLVGKVVGL
jgi:hypothetical protein